jgi:hypothetical protein
MLVPFGFLISSLVFVAQLKLHQRPKNALLQPHSEGDKAFLTSNSDAGGSANLDAGASTTYNLYKGQTLQIIPPTSFWYDTHVEISVGKARPGVETDVFWTLNSKCPAPKGQKYSLPLHYSYYSPPTGYHYRNIFLNPGSTIEGKISQSDGGTNFYVMRGAEAYEEVNGGYFSPDYLKAYAKYQSYTAAGRTKAFSYNTKNEKAYGDNIYILVWDNELQSDARFQVDSKFTMTTHDTSVFTKISCTVTQAQHTCTVPKVEQDDCILLHVVPTYGKDDQEVDAADQESLELDSDVSIDVNFYSTNTKMKNISLVSAIPLTVSVLISVFLSLWGWSLGWNKIDKNDEGELREALIPSEDSEEAITNGYPGAIPQRSAKSKNCISAVPL